MKKNLLPFFLIGIFLLGFMILFTPSSHAQGIFDGDLIRNPNAEGDTKYDIYIVKLVGAKKFKRLILSPHVFDSYGHLSWDKVLLIDQSTMDQYTTSNLVRCSDPDMGINDPKVYQLTPSGDTGIKTWLNMTVSEFSAQYDWDSIYIINQVDRDAYGDISDWKTYRNEEFEFEVKYPEYLSIINENEGVGGSFTYNIVLSNNSIQQGMNGIEVYVYDKIIPHEICPDFNVSAVSFSQSGEFEVYEDNFQQQGFQHLFTGGNYDYLMCLGPKKDIKNFIEQNIPNLNQILSTFKFTN